MLNQKTFKERSAIDALLNLKEESHHEIDYDVEIKKLYKPQYVIQSPPKLPQSKLLQLLCPKQNSISRQDIRAQSYERSSERIIVPEQYRPKYLIQQLKSHRNLRHISEHRTINVPTIQIVQSLQTISLIERNNQSYQKRVRKRDVQIPRFILKSRQKLC